MKNMQVIFNINNHGADALPLSSDRPKREAVMSSQNPNHRVSVTFTMMIGVAALAACSSNDNGGNAPPNGNVDGGSSQYVVSSLVLAPDDGRSAYVSLLDSLAPQQIDYSKAREYSGAADTWVYGGFVFVSDNETMTVTKFSTTSGKLEEVGKVSFGTYGFSDMGMWNNDFVSPTKSYMMNFKAREYVIWNPTTMKITGKLALPALEERQGFIIDVALADRGTELRGGRLYQPIYWTDEAYTMFTQDSRIVVIDVEKDAVVEVLHAPCPGMDFATQDELGNLYFSNWQSPTTAHLVRNSPATCVVKIPAGTNEVASAFTFASVAQGREGSAARYIGKGKMIFSAFHNERIAYNEQTDPNVLGATANWRIWSYDLVSGAAAVVSSIDWNSGSYYAFDIDDKTHVLSPAADYSASTIYAMDDDTGNALPLFQTRGWSLRLFKVR